MVWKPVALSVAVLGALIVVGRTVAQDRRPPPPPPPPPPPGVDAPPPPPPTGDDEAAAPVARPPATTRPAVQLKPGERAVAVTFAGGHDTDRRDGGRPVVLVAAGLNVPADAFRETFTHVRPAGEGSGGPTADEARRNKAALLAGLSKYGVTNDRLDEVSNYYRYQRGRDHVWRHRDATAVAVVAAGRVTGFQVTDGGAGYTTPPAVTVDGWPDLAVQVTLSFGTDLPTNGSVTAIALGKPATP